MVKQYIKSIYRIIILLICALALQFQSSVALCMSASDDALLPKAEPALSSPTTVQERMKPDLSNIVDSKHSILDTIEKVVKIVAYVVGALWVYFNFFKGRIYKPRLESKLEGELIKQETTSLIKISIQVKNVGLSKVNIKQKGTALRLLSYNPTNLNDPWLHQRTISVLLNHEWIEPGEPIEEQVLIPLPDSKIIAARAELILVSTKTMWETVVILT